MVFIRFNQHNQHCGPLRPTRLSSTARPAAAGGIARPSLASLGRHHIKPHHLGPSGAGRAERSGEIISSRVDRSLFRVQPPLPPVEGLSRGSSGSSHCPTLSGPQLDSGLHSFSSLQAHAGDDGLALEQLPVSIISSRRKASATESRLSDSSPHPSSSLHPSSSSHPSSSLRPSLSFGRSTREILSCLTPGDRQPQRTAPRRDGPASRR